MDIKSQNSDWLLWSSYWRQNVRVLERMGGGVSKQVEIDLDPLNVDIEYLSDLVIRTHCTRLGSGDRYSHYLPEEVYRKLINLIGEDKAWIAMHADIYPMIDWSKYAKTEKNKVPLRDCLKDIPAPFYQTKIRDGKTISDYTITKEGFYDDVICQYGHGEATGVGVCGASLCTSGEFEPLNRLSQFWVTHDQVNGIFEANIKLSNHDHDDFGIKITKITCDKVGLREWPTIIHNTMTMLLRDTSTTQWETKAIQGMVKECTDYLVYKYLVKDVIDPSNGNEIERRWVMSAKNAEAFLEGAFGEPLSVETLTQFYMGDKTRYRKIMASGLVSYQKTKKEGTGLIRPETNESVSQEVYDTSWKMAGRPVPVRKVRYTVKLSDTYINDYHAEVDLYHDGSMTVEVEFPDEKSAREFDDIPHWFGHEVTDIPGHSNFDLFLKLNNRPDPDIVYALGSGVLEFTYTNYKGDTSERKVVPPFEIYLGKTEHHPEEQWFLKATCTDRNAERHFALRDIKGFK